jgi:hypothetical protein
LIDGEHEFVVVAVAHPRGGPTDVYKIPTPRLVADMQEAHRVYLVEHPNAANKTCARSSSTEASSAMEGKTAARLRREVPGVPATV